MSIRISEESAVLKIALIAVVGAALLLVNDVLHVDSWLESLSQAKLIGLGALVFFIVCIFGCVVKSWQERRRGDKC